MGARWWFAVLAVARMALLGAQLALLSPALRSRQGLGNALTIPFFSLIYGPLLLCTRFCGTLAGVKHIYEQREKLRERELSPEVEDDIFVFPVIPRVGVQV